MKRTLTVGLALALALAGCGRKPSEPPPSPDTEPPAAETPGTAVEPAPDVSKIEPVAVSVYFPNQELTYLQAESRDVAAIGSEPGPLARSALEELLAGPEEDSHTRVVPKGVVVRGVEVQAGLASVDLSGDFITKFTGGSNVAGLAVYSVVNTVTAVPGIDKVQLLFDGKPAGEFAGVLDLSHPLEKAQELIGGEKL